MKILLFIKDDKRVTRNWINMTFKCPNIILTTFDIFTLRGISLHLTRRNTSSFSTPSSIIPSLKVHYTV
jgi:hypothetical protein